MKALFKVLVAVVLAALSGCVVSSDYRQTPRNSSPADIRAYEGMIEWAKQTPNGKKYEARRVQVWQHGNWVEPQYYWEAGSYNGSPAPYGYGYAPHGSGHYYRHY